MSLAKNIFSNWTNIFLSIISVFILFPLMTKVLGEEQYGIWLYIASVTGYFGLLQLGVPLANVRFISKFIASNEPEKINEVLSSNLLFFSVIGVVIGLIGVFFSLFIEHFFNISTTYINAAKIAMIFATINVSISFIIELFQGVMFALQEFVYVNAVKNITIILKLILFYYFVNQNNGIIAVSLILIIITLLQGVSICIMAKIKFKPLKISHKYINAAIFKEISKYSIFVMLMQLAGMISFQTDAIVIGSFISVASIISFSIAGNILNYLMQFIIGISSALMPKISALDAVNDNHAISDLYLKYSKLTYIIVLPICIFLVISGGDFIAIWMGEKYRDSSGNILTILIISYLFLLVQRGVAFPIFMGTSKMRFLSILMIVTSLLNLVLSIWWGIQFGLPGVAWGTTVPNLLTVIGILWFMNKHFDVNILNYLISTMLVPSVIAAVFAVTLICTKHVFIPHSYANVIVAAVISMVAYMSITWFTCFPKGINNYLESKS